MGLYDGILIKDNHLAALGNRPAAITWAVQVARERQGPHVPLVLEVDGLSQVDEALACRPDVILLDNMSCEDLQAAVSRRNSQAPGVQLEASGGITLSTIRQVAATGVDRASVGDLTHSAAALDIGLDYEAL
jgi:nicotinate-nucleotide pyrophosphorylase (carboxylating)